MQKLTVSQVNGYMKSLLDNDEILSDVTVVGEISNFKHHSSGHMYFTLKDKDSAISAAMFRGNNRFLKFVPENGMNVVASGRVSVYPAAGTYQIYVEKLSPDGEGALFAAFNKLKEKLESEGLFDVTKKKPIPEFPESVGVVTSPTGAAVRDIVSVIQRRYPNVKIILAPVLVQGTDAAPTIIDAINELNEKNACDVIIVGRGGGSIEDLWCFNDEQLARTVAASKIPVISAVGHETDFTICDFAADLRAPTPSAGAEIAVPDKNKLQNLIDSYSRSITNSMKSVLDRSALSLRAITSQPCIQSPEGALNICAQRLDIASSAIERCYENIISNYKTRLYTLSAGIDALSPISVLMRGYSLAYKDETLIKSTNQLEAGDLITLKTYDGSAHCKVIDILENENGKNDI